VPKSQQSSTFPPSIIRAGLTVQELHWLTSIPIEHLEMCKAGLGKPSPIDRLILTRFSISVMNVLPSMFRAFICRGKFRLLDQGIIKKKEKQSITRLLKEGKEPSCEKELDALLQKYAPQVESLLAGRYARETYLRS